MARRNAANPADPTVRLSPAIIMPCSCIELEIKYGQGECKCTRYRQYFPDCKCERESVSEHSPGPVKDNEVLVRSLFRKQHIGKDGRVKPTYFRREPPNRGFSVDRLALVGAKSLVESKRTDGRYMGYLRFTAARSSDVRAAKIEDGTRLFCVYDSATVENRAHADICQNVNIPSGTENRKQRMMEFAWELRHVFGTSEPSPPASV